MYSIFYVPCRRIDCLKEICRKIAWSLCRNFAYASLEQSLFLFSGGGREILLHLRYTMVNLFSAMCHGWISIFHLCDMVGNFRRYDICGFQRCDIYGQDIFFRLEPRSCCTTRCNESGIGRDFPRFCFRDGKKSMKTILYNFPIFCTS